MIEVTATDLIKSFNRRHPGSALCPGCGENLMREGITRIVYTFEICPCDRVKYEHLAEQLWHRRCFPPSDHSDGGDYAPGPGDLDDSPEYHAARNDGSTSNEGGGSVEA